MMALPLPRSEVEGGSGAGAFVTMVTQFLGPQHLLITSAIDYQQAGASAAPHAIVTFYRELADSKQIVLGRVDIIGGTVLAKESARKFAVSLAEMYLADERYEHVRRFNKEPGSFDFNAVLALFGCRL